MGTLLLLLLSLADPLSNPATHLRAISPVMRSLIDEAMVTSPIINRLIADLQHSDTIVYVELTGSPEIPRARTILAAASPEARFLRISINVLIPPMDRVPLLAHELQHATEIAGAANVRDQEGMRELFKRIGLSGTGDRYETTAATEIERRVRAEQFARRGRRCSERVNRCPCRCPGAVNQFTSKTPSIVRFLRPLRALNDSPRFTARTTRDGTRRTT